MGDISRALGLGSTLDHNGKTYTLSPWTYKLQGEFERYIQAAALKDLKDLLAAGALTPAEYDSDRRELRDKILSGELSFGGEYIAKSISQLRHFRKLVLLMLLPTHPEVNEEFVQEIISARLEELYDKVAETNQDPTTAPVITPGPTSPPPSVESPPTSTPS